MGSGESHILLGRGRIGPPVISKLQGRFPKFKRHAIVVNVNFLNKVQLFGLGDSGEKNIDANRKQRQ